MAEVTIDRAALAMVLRGTRFKKALNEIGAATVQTAQAMAPERTGHYKASIVAKVTAGGPEGVFKLQIQANDFKSNWVEFGTTHSAAQHVLSRAAEATIGPVTGGKDTGDAS